jgi:hypothetical protein
MFWLINFCLSGLCFIYRGWSTGFGENFFYGSLIPFCELIIFRMLVRFMNLGYYLDPGSRVRSAGGRNNGFPTDNVSCSGALE